MNKRRYFLKTAGLSVAATLLPGIGNTSDSIAKKDDANTDIKLGVASYSLREFPTEQALDMTLRCGVKRICFKSMHLPLDASDSTIQETLALCKEKGVTLYGGGVIYMKTKEEVDQAFSYAKKAEMEMIVGVPNYELLEYVEGKVKAYNIKLAIHNHGPGDDLYPSAESAYVKIKSMDKRMGLCLDIGHTVRIGRDPVKDFTDYYNRIFDVHIKDVTEKIPEGQTCIIGRGVIDIPLFLKTVIKLQYKGTLALEYEADGSDPLPGMMASMGYLKGVLKMITK